MLAKFRDLYVVDQPGTVAFQALGGLLRFGMVVAQESASAGQSVLA
jgi:hypothetical protein